MGLVEEIKNALELEVRPSEEPDKYFEAVFESKDLDKLLDLVRKQIGESVKSPGRYATFPKNVGELVNSMGGLRIEQSFYFKQEPNGEYIYVALWPWQTNPSKTTLKIGKGSFPVPSLKKT